MGRELRFDRRSEEREGEVRREGGGEGGGKGKEGREEREESKETICRSSSSRY